MGKVDIGRRCHILHTQTTWIEWKYYVWFLCLISIFDLFLLQKIPGSTVARGTSYLTQKIYGSGGLLVTQMMELEIIPITAATLSWSRLINRDSSWVENQQHFLSFIYQLQLVLSSAALLACRPGFLCRSVQLPKQGGKKKSPKTGPELRAPPASAMESRWRFLLTAAGCSQQSRRGNFSFGVIHHRAWEQEEEEDRGRTDSPRPDTQRLASFKRLRIGTFMAHPRTHMWKQTARTCTQDCEVILAHLWVSCLSSTLFPSATGHMTRLFLFLWIWIYIISKSNQV